MYSPEEIALVRRYTQGITPQFKTRDMPNIQPKTSNIKRFEDIQNVLFINLDERTDRRDETVQHLTQLGFKPQRLSAVKFTPGALGCSLSHIKAIELAKANKWTHVLVCEDDALFGDSSRVKEQVNCFLQRHDDWDIILFSVYVAKGLYVDSCSARVYDSYCTTAYLVRQEYYDVLLHNYKRGAYKFFNYKINTPIDHFWSSLQNRDQWYTILPIVAVQRPSKSDVNDGKVFTDFRDGTITSYTENIQNYPSDEQAKIREIVGNT
jgi:GR25 family glycosyltransferase involved in LPS biosynthesis